LKDLTSEGTDFKQSKKYGDLKLVPLAMYAGVSQEKQNKVFEPTKQRCRKVIVSTNICETSLTIYGIVYVIDCGFVKVRNYNAILGVENLNVVPISKATAKQRAGRAGRLRPGKCYRLYTQQDYLAFSDAPIPEIERTNLTPVILQLKALGVDNILNFHYMSPPPVENVVRALEILFSLGALDESGKLTNPTGMVLAEFPVEPLFAKILISSGREWKCSEEILSITAMLSIQQAFQYQENKSTTDDQKKKFAVYEGDHLTLLNVLNAFVKQKKIQIGQKNDI